MFSINIIKRVNSLSINPWYIILFWIIIFHIFRQSLIRILRERDRIFWAFFQRKEIQTILMVFHSKNFFDIYSEKIFSLRKIPFILRIKFNTFFSKESFFARIKYFPWLYPSNKFNLKNWNTFYVIHWTVSKVI